MYNSFVSNGQFIGKILTDVFQDVVDVNHDMVEYTSSYRRIIYDSLFSKIFYDVNHRYYIKQVDDYFVEARRIYDAMSRCMISRHDIIIDMFWKEQTSNNVYRDGRGFILDDFHRRLLLSNIINNTFYKYFSDNSVSLEINFQVIRHDILLSPDRFIIRHL